MSIKINHI